MTNAWIKSLQCNSKASDDVVHHRIYRKNHNHGLLHISSCKNSVRNLSHIVEIVKPAKPEKPKPTKTPRTQSPKQPVSRKPEPGSTIRTRNSRAESFSQSLTELSEGHPSRNVVEIIFHSGWGDKNFSGRVEMVFKVQNLARTVTRFEEYRELVKSQASCRGLGNDSDDHARCVADGNEVMRFYCLGATTSGGAYYTRGSAWGFNGSKGAAVCMFSGSGSAHENAGGGRGRRTMLVCRVIAGRVGKRPSSDSLIDVRGECDSVGGVNGELYVFDSRALLPCFLVIYKL